MFSFYNLSAANILPGSVCYVSGCYSGVDIDTYVKTPKRSCTIPGETKNLNCIMLTLRIS